MDDDAQLELDLLRTKHDALRTLAEAQRELLTAIAGELLKLGAYGRRIQAEIQAQGEQ